MIVYGKGVDEKTLSVLKFVVKIVEKFWTISRFKEQETKMTNLVAEYQ